MTSDRCRCSHIRSAHHRSRLGRVLCQYPCGCSEYRPDDGRRWREPPDWRADTGTPVRHDMGAGRWDEGFERGDEL